MAERSVDEIWRGDLLKRQQDAEFLIRFLRTRIVEREKIGAPKSYVLNLDAKWGDGKTFFIRHLAETLRHHGHLVAEVNAWKDDHADDPLLAVMAAIDVAIAPLTARDEKIAAVWNDVRRVGARVAIAAAKGTAFHWLRKAMGEGVDDAIKAGAVAVQDEVATVLDERAEAMLAHFSEGQRSIDTFRAELSRVLAAMETEDIPSPLFVLVDELDRCRPPYAIALLERVKHLFEIDNVVFIIATDTSQLRHAIGAIYGSSFDSTKYLFRFFDRSYSFEVPVIYDFVGAMLLAAPLDPKKVSLPPRVDLQSFLTFAFTAFGTSLRDIAQCYDLARTVVTAWDLKVPVEMAVLLPMVVGQHRNVYPELTTDFVSRLLSFSDLERSRLREMTLGFVSYDGGSEEHLTLIDVFEAFVELGEGTIEAFLKRSSQGGLAEWISSRLNEELSLVRNGQIDRRTKSVLTRYAAAVRTAGRMVADTG